MDFKTLLYHYFNAIVTHLHHGDAALCEAGSEGSGAIRSGGEVSWKGVSRFFFTLLIKKEG